MIVHILMQITHSNASVLGVFDSYEKALEDQEDFEAKNKDQDVYYEIETFTVKN